MALNSERRFRGSHSVTRSDTARPWSCTRSSGQDRARSVLLTLEEEKLPEFELTQPVSLYRICRTIYADLSGLGAAKFPSRWNREGQRAVYTATSQALALSELLVHLPKGSQPQGYSLLTITMSDADVVVRRSLEEGRRWFDRVGKFLAERPDDPIAFIVPSVIVPEYNVVLYPRTEKFEPEFVRIESVSPFAFDPRLFEHIAATYVQ